MKRIKRKIVMTLAALSLVAFMVPLQGCFYGPGGGGWGGGYGGGGYGYPAYSAAPFYGPGICRSPVGLTTTTAGRTAAMPTDIRPSRMLMASAMMDMRSAVLMDMPSVMLTRAMPSRMRRTATRTIAAEQLGIDFHA